MAKKKKKKKHKIWGGCFYFFFYFSLVTFKTRWTSQRSLKSVRFHWTKLYYAKGVLEKESLFDSKKKRLWGNKTAWKYTYKYIYIYIDTVWCTTTFTIVGVIIIIRHSILDYIQIHFIKEFFEFEDGFNDVVKVFWFFGFFVQRGLGTDGWVQKQNKNKNCAVEDCLIEKPFSLVPFRLLWVLSVRIKAFFF